MKYPSNKKHPIAFLLAAMLVCQPISAQAVTFADINQVPWPGAEVSINKAAELGLVVGETINSKSYFKPKDPVSLTQSCQLAYKLLLETGKAKADSQVVEKWTVVMNTYKIQSWAHPAVSFCLEKGIVQIADLNGFVNGEVNVSATREQAAEILGRALEVGVPSAKASASSTKFVDNASISADAIPYIALLNTNGVVNGDDTNKFNPKKTLNRTETAVMVTNLYKVLDAAATAAPEPALPTSQSGKVAALTNFYVNFENSAAYYLYSSTSIPVTLNGTTSSISELAELFKVPTAMEATLTLDGNSKITAMAVTADNMKEEEKEKDTEGIITKITHDTEDDDGKLEINHTSSYTVKNVDKVDIEITDEDGDENEYSWEELLDMFKDCKEDDKVIEVELTVDKDGKLQKIVGEIADDDGDAYKTGSTKGKIEKITFDEKKEKGEITIDGKVYKAPATEDVEIEVQDGNDEIDSWISLYEAFKDGKTMELDLEVDDDEVVEITGRVTVAVGYLVDFEHDYLTLEGKKSDTEVDYYFTEYERYEDDDEDEENDDWVEATEDLKIKGLSNVTNLYAFFEKWLDSEKTELGTDSKDDTFLMEFTLDKDGFITNIKAEKK